MGVSQDECSSNIHGVRPRVGSYFLFFFLQMALAFSSTTAGEHGSGVMTVLVSICIM